MRDRRKVWSALVLLAACATKEQVKLTEGVTLRYAKPWTVSKHRPGETVELVKTATGRPEEPAEARMTLTIEVRRSHDEAVRRLGEIADEVTSPSRFEPLQGWPMLVRRHLADMPLPGQKGDEEKGGPIEPRKLLMVTVAVAAAERLVRLEAALPPAADAKLADEVEAIGKSMSFAAQGDPRHTEREIEGLRRARPVPALPPPQPQPSKTGERQEGPPRPGTATQVQASGRGELEVAISTNGQNVVIGSNFATSRSGDGGTTFTAATVPVSNDPSLAFAQSTAFFYASISATAAGCNTSIGRSTDNGQNFPFRSNAVACPGTGAGQCFPDQEHIAADRWNAAPGGDQVYSTWRNFVPIGGTWPACNQPCVGVSCTASSQVVCSADGGATWPTQRAVGAGDFPHITVGTDGFVYVVYRAGANVMLNKFSSCSAGFAQQVGFPVTVGSFTDVTCPVPGLDRCNNGNVLSSPTVAVDELDTAHVFIAYATNTASGSNENIIVRDSVDGGQTWPAARVVTANAATTARRYMPWLCAYGGMAHVGWYDRSNATAASNDLTAYHRAVISVKGGALQVAPEVNVSGVDDQQCGAGGAGSASNWPCRTRATADSDSCSAQPQKAGRCSATTATRCDYDVVPSDCPAGETCLTGSGCPKYGDYNGNACFGGRIISAWASATTPPGLPAGTGIRVFADTSFTPDDFFVRDWTVSATDRDLGPEPSTNPVFWTASDVWNRATDSAGGPPFPNDTPVTDLVQVGTMTPVTNYAFARVHRRAPAAANAPSVNVTAHFYYADFGFGTPFANAGTAADPTLTFAPTDTSKVLANGYPWSVPTTVSTHLCLAVEISAPGDPVTSPTLLGRTAGGATDALVRADNNKAQRNIDTNVVPGAPGVAEAPLSFYAIVHNPDLFRRDIVVRYRVDPKTLAQLSRAEVRVVGGPAEKLRPEGRLTLKGMEPAENRWIELSYAIDAPEGSQPLPVHFDEMVADQPVNGFAIVARPSAVPAVRAANLNGHVAVFRRLAAAFGVKEAQKDALAAERMKPHTNQKQAAPSQEYVDLLSRSAGLLKPVVQRLRRDAGGEGRAIQPIPTIEALEKAIKAKDAHRMLIAHAALLNQVDALETQAQKAQGDVADVLHNVRWQKHLFEKLPRLEASRSIVESSTAFIDSYQQRKARNDDFVALTAKLLPGLRATAKSLDANGELEARVKEIERSARVPLQPALQRAHRGYLLRLQALAP